MELALLEENERRFNQARNTPFLMEPLLSEVGELGFGPASADILAGTYTCSPEVDPAAAQLIPHLAMPQSVRECPAITWEHSEENYISRWSSVKERTSSGLSGYHFGHCIAGSKDADICRFESLKSFLPTQCGYSPE